MILSTFLNMTASEDDTPKLFLQGQGDVKVGSSWANELWASKTWGFFSKLTKPSHAVRAE